MGDIVYPIYNFGLEHFNMVNPGTITKHPNPSPIQISVFRYRCIPFSSTDSKSLHLILKELFHLPNPSKFRCCDPECDSEFEYCPTDSYHQSYNGKFFSKVEPSLENRYMYGYQISHYCNDLTVKKLYRTTPINTNDE